MLNSYLELQTATKTWKDIVVEIMNTGKKYVCHIACCRILYCIPPPLHIFLFLFLICYTGYFQIWNALKPGDIQQPVATCNEFVVKIWRLGIFHITADQLRFARYNGAPKALGNRRRSNFTREQKTEKIQIKTGKCSAKTSQGYI